MAKTPISTAKTISTLDVRKGLGDILNRAAYGGESFVVERKGRPVAAVVPVERLQKLERIEEDARQWLREFFARPREPISEEEADRLALEAVQEVRREKRARERRKRRTA